MKIIFIGILYYQGPVRHLYRIFEIFKALGRIYKTIGCEVKYFTKQKEALPLQDLIKQEKFEEELETCDLVFMWNGSLDPERKIAENCWHKGIPVYFLELGWMPQRGTFYFDRKGVNYESSILDWQPHLLTEEQIEWVNIHLAFYHKYHAEITDINLGKEPFVFIPFQVESDSQIIRYSPKIKKMQELVDYVAMHIPGKIIFKIHPKDRPGKIIWPNTEQRYELRNDGSTHDYLRHCKYVVTINSTVGVEALSYNKPVINLGNAFYEGRKMTYKVNNDEDFRNAIKWAEEGKVATEVIQSFMYYLFNKQWYSEDLKNPEKILGLIENITGRT